MPLARGFTSFHGIVLNGVEARDFRNMEKRLRNRIDGGHFVAAQDVLTEIKEFAGECEVNRQAFEAIRKDASDRWQRTRGKFPDTQ